MSQDSPVVVVGGGLAGSACALALAGRGQRVTLIEASAMLGGRVTSTRLPGIDRPIDNGQHVVFRIYGRFLQLLATCEARDIIKLQKQTKLPYLEVEKGIISSIRSGNLHPQTTYRHHCST